MPHRRCPIETLPRQRDAAASAMPPAGRPDLARALCLGALILLTTGSACCVWRTHRRRQHPPR